MRPPFGDFLASAGANIDAVTGFDGQLPRDAARAVVAELDRVVTTMARCADGFTTSDAGPRDAPGHTGPDARLALRQAAGSMRAAAGALGGGRYDHAHPAAARLSAAADCLTAGHDLLQTHFAPGPFGSRLGNSPWAPAMVSGPVTAALLTEMTGYARRLAPWAIRLAAPHPAGTALPSPARAAVASACQWLRVAEAATWAADIQHPSSRTPALLHAIPANTVPPRQRLQRGEAVSGLCAVTAVSAERLRHLALAFYSSPAGADLGSANSWQRTAQGAAVTGHCSELVLRALADRTLQLGAAFVGSALRQAADMTASAWQAWRMVAHAWDTVTTGVTGQLTPVAAEIGDLVLSAGRLVHPDPAWTPARGHASGLRDPAELAADRHGVVTVLTAVHQVADTLACIAGLDREAVRAAAAHRRLYVPTRLLPAAYDMPYRYAPVPPRMADAMLSDYDAAVEASTSAALALDRVAVAVEGPSSVLAAIRSAAARGMPHLVCRDSAPTGWPAAQPRPVQTGLTQRRIGITGPGREEHAAAIGQAARDVIAGSTSRSRGRNAAVRQGRSSNRRQGSRHAAQLAARDNPDTGIPLVDRRVGNPAEHPAEQDSRRQPAPRPETQRLSAAPPPRHAPG